MATKAKVTLDTIEAADGSRLKVTTRIDSDGLLRVDVYRETNKTQPVCSGCVTVREIVAL